MMRWSTFRDSSYLVLSSDSEEIFFVLEQIRHGEGEIAHEGSDLEFLLLLDFRIGPTLSHRMGSPVFIRHFSTM